MIGSSSTGSAFSYADLNAIEPAILNAISDESTVWYEPSTSRTRTPWTGAPASSPCCHRLLDALVDRGPEALRDDAADDLVDELVALVALERLDHDVAVAELAAAAGLLLVAALRARLLADRLEVRDARLVQLDLDAEAALEPVDRDLDVHLATGRRAAARPSAGRGGGAASGPPRAGAAAPAATLSSSPFAFGVTAKLITGSGKSICGGSTVALGVERARRRSARPSASRRRRCRPSTNSSARLVLLALQRQQLPSRSFAWARALTSVESAPTRARVDAEAR